MENIIISDPARLDRIKKAFIKAGVANIHIRCDFDRTLTTAFVDGKSVPSIISVLRNGNYLTPDYANEAMSLYNKYHPIEINPKIPVEEKMKAMQEWWMTHFKLLIKSGLNKKDLVRAVESNQITFRPGFDEFCDLLSKYSIPLLIISSSGLGGDAISMYLEKTGHMKQNVYIVSNNIDWDEQGNAIRIKEPIIHTLNKDETAIESLPVFRIIKERKNVILLGDSLDDVKMVTGFRYDNLIKIGFLNEDVEKNLVYYKKQFDVVIVNDSSLEFASGLLREIANFKI
jgi:5'-nucleotidase